MSWDTISLNAMAVEPSENTVLYSAYTVVGRVERKKSTESHTFLEVKLYPNTPVNARPFFKDRAHLDWMEDHRVSPDFSWSLCNDLAHHLGERDQRSLCHVL